MNCKKNKKKKSGRKRGGAYGCVSPGVVVVVGVHLLGPGVLAVGRPVDLVHVDGGLLLIPGLAEDNREPVGGGRVVHVPLPELGDGAASLHLKKKIRSITICYCMAPDCEIDGMKHASDG
jgi:hypothetical protein